MWHKCHLGQTGNQCQNGNPQYLTWETALEGCETLELSGHTDWRLPDIKELHGIVDQTRDGPCINTNYFVSGVGAFWSSTSSTVTQAWYQGFDLGLLGSQAKTQSGFVRCVRH